MVHSQSLIEASANLRENPLALCDGGQYSTLLSWVKHDIDAPTRSHHDRAQISKSFYIEMQLDSWHVHRSVKHQSSWKLRTHTHTRMNSFVIRVLNHNRSWILKSNQGKPFSSLVSLTKRILVLRSALTGEQTRQRLVRPWYESMPRRFHRN